MQAEPRADPAGKSERWAYAEQLFYDRSPAGVWVTTAALYALLIGAFAIAAAVDGLPWIVHSRAGGAIDHRAWIAICLALIVCTALGLQRYSRLMEQKDAPAFVRALDGGDWNATFSRPRLQALTLVGAVAGAAAMLWFTPGRLAAAARTPATTLWFTAMAALLGALFLRGGELTATAARQTRLLIGSELQIDLLRIELLYPWGRVAGRTALIWFAVSAATLLMFVGASTDLYTLALTLGSAAIGGWVFIGTLGLIHQRIRAAKAVELEALRGEIDAGRAALGADPAAPARLQSLLAYEARIAGAPEWPFDQTILIRVAASALILTVPWFGQAIAGVLVEHFGKLLP